MWLSKTRRCSYLLPFLCALSLTTSAMGVGEDVTTCQQLHGALVDAALSPTSTDIHISGRIDCSSFPWPEKIHFKNVGVGVVIRGRSVFDQIDWGSHEDAVIIGGGAQVGFLELLLVQDAFGASASALLKFMNVEAGSAFLSKVLLGVRTCTIDALQIKEMIEGGYHDAEELGIALVDQNTLRMRTMEMSLDVEETSHLSICDVFFLVCFEGVQNSTREVIFNTTCGTFFSSTYLPNTNKHALGSMRSASADDSSISAAQAVLLGSLLVFFGVGLVVPLVVVLIKWRAFSSKQPSISSPGVEMPSGVLAQRVLNEESRTLAETSNSGGQIDPKRIFRGERIQRCGNVFKGFYLDQLVAVKIVEHRPELLTEEGELREAVIGKSATHPNIVKIFAFWTLPVEIPDALRTTDSFPSQSRELQLKNQRLQTFIAMEYCDERTLDRAVMDGIFENNNGSSDTERILKTLADVAEALNCLHSNHVVHCDLKARNVYLVHSESDSRGFIAKVGGFGLARRGLSANASPHPLLQYASVSTTAPEVWDERCFTPAADVYSFGILVWEIVSGMKAFLYLTPDQTCEAVKKGVRPPIPASCSPDLTSLMVKCWKESLQERPNFEDILSTIKMLANDLVRVCRFSTPAVDGPGYSILSFRMGTTLDNPDSKRGKFLYRMRKKKNRVVTCSATSSADETGQMHSLENGESGMLMFRENPLWSYEEPFGKAGSLQHVHEIQENLAQAKDGPLSKTTGRIGRVPKWLCIVREFIRKL